MNGNNNRQTAIQKNFNSLINRVIHKISTLHRYIYKKKTHHNDGL